MASAAQLCNMALSHIGSDARVSSISPPDGSVEAGYCATFYDQARTELLEPGNWSFALKRAPLAQVANVSSAWPYAYAMPSDCLRPLRVLTVAGDATTADFAREGDVLFSTEPEAVLLYTRDVTDTTRFSPSFATALAYLLAAYIAGPVIKGSDGMQVSDSMRQRAMALADVSATASANASSVYADTPYPTLQAVRA